MPRTVIAAQGEANIYRIDALPSGMSTRPAERDAQGRAIIGHSESGHHHTLDDPSVEVMERMDNVPAGMKILYAIVRNPTALRQDAASPHVAIPLDPGIYEYRISREFDPFSEQARRVAD